MLLWGELPLLISAVCHSRFLTASPRHLEGPTFHIQFLFNFTNSRWSVSACCFNNSSLVRLSSSIRHFSTFIRCANSASFNFFSLCIRCRIWSWMVSGSTVAVSMRASSIVVRITAFTASYLLPSIQRLFSCCDVLTALYYFPFAPNHICQWKFYARRTHPLQCNCCSSSKWNQMRALSNVSAKNC